MEKCVGNITLTGNQTNGTGNQACAVEGTVQPFVIAFCLIVSFFILFSNISILIFYHRMKDAKIRRRISIIFNLCFSDIILGIAGTMFALYRIVNTFNRPACVLIFFLQEFSVTASLFHTFCICLERFLAVKSKVLHTSVFGKRGRFYFMTISWVVLCLYTGTKKVLVSSTFSICTLPGIYGPYYQTSIRMYTFVVFMPLLIGTISLYVITLCKIRSKGRQIGTISGSKFVPTANTSTSNSNDLPTSSQSNDRKDNAWNIKLKPTLELQTSCSTVASSSIYGEKYLDRSQKRGSNKFSSRKVTSKQDNTLKAMRNIGIIILVMISTTGTGSLFLAVEAVCNTCPMTVEIRMSLAFLWYLNSALNPIIYILIIKELRDEMKKMCKCRFS